MKEINMVRKPEMVKLVSQISGVTQEKTEAVLDAYFEAIYVSLTNGQGVSLIGIGKIEPKYMEAKPERDVFVPLIGDTVHKEAEPACYRVRFKPSDVLLNKLKADSLENNID